MRHVARELNLGVGFVGPVTVIGPAAEMTVLATLAELANQRQIQASSGRPEPWPKTSRLAWPRLSQPRSLAIQLAQEAGYSIPEADMIPHDLWDQCDLPPMTWNEKMTLILAGCDLHFQLDPASREVILTRFPERASIQRDYPISGSATELARQLRTLYPRAFLRVAGTHIHVRSLLEDHWSLEDQLNPGNSRQAKYSRRTSEDQKRYTLTVQDEPIGPLLKVLAQRVGCQLIFEEVPPPQLEQRVAFSVTEATLAELLEAATAPAALRFSIDGSEITVTVIDQAVSTSP